MAGEFAKGFLELHHSYTGEGWVIDQPISAHHELVLPLVRGEDERELLPLEVHLFEDENPCYEL